MMGVSVRVLDSDMQQGDAHAICERERGRATDIGRVPIEDVVCEPDVATVDPDRTTVLR